MRKITLITLMLFTALSYAQVGINTNTPDASSALEIASTTGGILIPRLTETQRDAIATPATGLMIYQTDQTTGFYFFNGIAWTRIEGVVGPQGETGPAGPQGPTGAAGTNGTNGSDGADGADGKGISSTVDNGDGTFTITYTDNTTFTTSDFTGPTGATGPQGPQGETGAAGTNGTNGSDGAAGVDGNGIASTTDNNDGTFTLTFDDGTTFTTSDLTGPTGATGPQGIQGLQGDTGAQGLQGPTGPQGPQGDIGATGATGADGAQGPAGPQGATGTPYTQPTYTVNTFYAELGGYVIQISPSGKHGVVAAMQDQGTSSWYEANNLLSNPNNHDSNGMEFSDWRLPTLRELNLMYDIYIGGNGAGFVGWNYSCSTSLNYSDVWYRAFNGGSISTRNKNLVDGVRAVRDF